MKMFVPTLALCMILSLFVIDGDCAVALRLNAMNPDYPGKCYEDDTYDPPIILTPGETNNHIKGNCLEVYCGNDFSLHYATCIPFKIEGAECFIVPLNLTLPYPDCCEHGECKKPE